VEPHRSNTNAATNNITFLFINFLLLLQWNLVLGTLPAGKAGLFQRKRIVGFPAGNRIESKAGGFSENKSNQFNSLPSGDAAF
jgi:hypothetical protein